MDLEKAKEILSAYRPDHHDAGDPLMNEALTMVETHPELRDWFEHQMDMDAKVFAAFDNMPPLDVSKKATLMGNYPISQKSKVIAFKPLLAIAAIVIFSLLCAVFSHHGNYKKNLDEITSFRTAMSYFASSPYVSLDHKDDSLPDLQAWLKSQKLPTWSVSEIPATLLDETPLGCAKIEWRDHYISLTCFHDKNGDIVHLFSVTFSSTSEETLDDIEAVAWSHDLQSAGWFSEGHAFLLMGSEPHVEIEKYLASEA